MGVVRERLLVGERRGELGHALDLHVAVLELPLVLASISTAPIKRVMLSSFGKMPTTSARRFTSLFSRSSGLVECSFARCWAGKEK